MDRKRKIELINELCAIAEELNWVIGFEGDDDSECNGLIIGTEDYLKNVLKLADIFEVEVYEFSPSEKKKGIIQ